MTSVEQLQTTQIPEEWLATTIVQHIEDPYSEAAFAEEEKPLIDLGELDIDACVHLPFDEYDNLRPYIKRYNDVRIPEGTPPELVRAHNLFFDAARRILTPEQYEAAAVDFTYRRSDVDKGAMPIGQRPHIDRYPDPDKQLRLMAIACNSLPTIALQGSLKPQHLRPNGWLENLRLQSRLRREPIPTSRLVLLAPALLHDTCRATEFTPNRLFLRWHLSF